MKKINDTVSVLHEDAIALDPDGKRVLQPGDRFEATDKLGHVNVYQYLGMYTYEYHYPCAMIASEHVDYHLYNEIECHFIDVELAWFGERKIKILEAEQ